MQATCAQPFAETYAKAQTHVHTCALTQGSIARRKQTKISLKTKPHTQSTQSHIYTHTHLNTSTYERTHANARPYTRECKPTHKHAHKHARKPASTHTQLLVSAAEPLLQSRCRHRRGACRGPGLERTRAGPAWARFLCFVVPKQFYTIEING